MDELETGSGWMDRLRWRPVSVAPWVRAAGGSAIIAFLIVAIVPIGWIGSLAWNLYLDRLGSWFVPPVGNAGRLVLAIIFAILVAGIAAAIMLALGKRRAGPEAVTADTLDAADAEIRDETTRRRRVDHHPDAPPRPPIRAGSDLPAEGLGPLPLVADTENAAPAAPAAPGDADDFLDLSLADRAPDIAEAEAEAEAEVDAEAEAMAESVEAAPDMPAPVAAPQPQLPADASLGAMVERLEAGLERRRQLRGQDAPVDDAEVPAVDFALEAALSTLQRMARRAVG